MNLLEIILEYLEKRQDSEEDATAHLNHLVEDAGMPSYLVKHIEECAERSRVDHQGTYQVIEKFKPTKLAERPEPNEVNVWTVKNYFPDYEE